MPYPSPSVQSSPASTSYDAFGHGQLHHDPHASSVAKNSKRKQSGPGRGAATGRGKQPRGGRGARDPEDENDQEEKDHERVDRFRRFFTLQPGERLTFNDLGLMAQHLAQPVGRDDRRGQKREARDQLIRHWNQAVQQVAKDAWNEPRVGEWVALLLDVD